MAMPALPRQTRPELEHDYTRSTELGYEPPEAAGFIPSPSHAFPTPLPPRRVRTAPDPGHWGQGLRGRRDRAVPARPSGAARAAPAAQLDQHGPARRRRTRARPGHTVPARPDSGQLRNHPRTARTAA